MPTYQFEVRLSYFGFENFVEWTLYGTAFLFVVDFDECHRRTGLRTGWQWQQLGATDGAKRLCLSRASTKQEVSMLSKEEQTHWLGNRKVDEAAKKIEAEASKKAKNKVDKQPDEVQKRSKLFPCFHEELQQKN